MSQGFEFEVVLQLPFGSPLTDERRKIERKRGND